MTPPPTHTHTPQRPPRSLKRGPVLRLSAVPAPKRLLCPRGATGAAWSMCDQLAVSEPFPLRPGLLVGASLTPTANRERRNHACEQLDSWVAARKIIYFTSC